MSRDFTYHPVKQTVKYILAAFTIAACLFAAPTAKAQYFGQNKVRYKKLDFKVYKTPHFEIYYYMKNDSLIKRFAQENELWYTLHQQVFRDTFSRANPIILYNNHPDFQQTTVIEGDIGVGTGGVTEGLKNRVVMPIMETNHTTRHVLGHELVHAFQYHILLGRDSASYENLGNIPLWMIEGMAEYLSIGKKDAYTAMWMRDAYLNKDIPTVRALTESNKYFPYRYGEAFWSFIGSTYGDTIIVPFFKNTARFGLQYGIRRTFGYDDKTLSTLWKNSIESTYKPLLKDTLQSPVGFKIVDDKNGSDMNVAPSVSPDGKYITFLSSKSLFTIDLYLADAKSGRIIKQLTSKVSNSHIDEFNFIESGGTWSPDSKQFAFSVFNQGRNKILVVDVPSGRVRHNISMGKAEQLSNLTWSPDGKNIAFQGMSEGQGDLYSYNFDTKKVTQLTNDKYSDYQPSYSPDGKKIIFSSDRTTYDRSLSQDITFNLAELDIATGTVKDITVFNGSNNLNPVYSADGRYVYFLSNYEGFRNLFRYELASGKTEKLTDYFTGISGITEFSPALSISKNDDVVYSYYRKQKYTLYNAKASDFKAEVVSPAANPEFTAGLLPPPKAVGVDLINSNLNNFLAYPRISTDSIRQVPYKPMFQLDYLASSGVGVGVNSYYGAGLASGIQGAFSDILGQQKIYAGAAVNGQIYDFGAQVAYINQKSRWDKGISLSHIPYQFGYYFPSRETRNIDGTNYDIYNEDSYIIRNFEDAASVFTSYPISRINRLQFAFGASYNSYRIDRYRNSYIIDPVYGLQFYDADRSKISSNEAEQVLGFNLSSYSLLRGSVAFIGDNSFFGVAAPLNGFRYHFETEYVFGTYNFFAPTIDFRKYWRVAPVTFATRLYGIGRFGDTGQLYPLFLGYPFLIRGYEAQSFYNNSTTAGPLGIQQLQGNRMAVFNFEVRLPFTGPEKLAQIKSGFLFTDLNLFFDAGLAWDKGNKIKFQKEPDFLGYQSLIDPVTKKPILDENGNEIKTPAYDQNQRVPVYSAGISLRVNLFGALILEPYFAIPFNRNDVKKPVFGLAFTPGW